MDCLLRQKLPSFSACVGGSNRPMPQRAHFPPSQTKQATTPSELHPCYSSLSIMETNNAVHTHRSINTCVCQKPECSGTQKDLVIYHTASSSNDDVWGLANPISVRFDANNASYKTWLFLLGLCKHIRAFEQNFPEISKRSGATNIFVNRIHFPRALLEHRETYKIKFNSLGNRVLR